MGLSHLDADAARNHAIVSDRESLLALSMPEVEAALRAELVNAPAQMLQGLLSGNEDDYLKWVVEQLHRMTQVPFALIGELHGEDWERVRTLELRMPSGRGDNFVYELAGTPCSHVVGKTACIYPSGVAELFPRDEMLAQMSVQSYVGVPLFDPGGRPLGLVILLDKEPWGERKMRAMLGLIVAFRPRIETVLINRRARRDMELLSERIAVTDDVEPLGHLVLSFAYAMQVRAAFVSSFTDDSRRRMRTSARVVDGQLREAVEYEPGNTPLAAVELAGEVLIRDELATVWPGSAEFVAFPACSCLVMSLTGADGQLIGQLGILHDRPLNRRIGEQPVVRAFRQQIAFDLRRQILETERLATEGRLLELQRSESLGLLAGGVAHDFNNLLVGMLGNVDLALLDLPARSEAGDETREYLVDIRDAARSATQLCRQMLAYAGRAGVELMRFELGAEFDELSRLLAASISRNIQIVVERSADPSWIVGDPVQIRQLLMNLITNAGEAIGESGGRIEVRLGQVSVSEGEPIHGVTGSLPSGSYVWLSVRDDGCGMDGATLDRIFEPFFTTKPTGHGLGLAAMLGVVRAHRGTFVVSSELGVGTDFRVYLPAAEAG